MKNKNITFASNVFINTTLIMSLNKVMLIGNVGRDPEVRYRDNGQGVANFTLATTDRAYTLQNGTQVPERTEWHNIVVWGKLAEIVEKYVHKGDKLYLEGSLRSHSYDDQNGVKRYVTEIHVDNMEMLSPKGNASAKPFAPTEAAVQNEPKSQPSQTEGMPF